MAVGLLCQQQKILLYVRQRLVSRLLCSSTNCGCSLFAMLLIRNPPMDASHYYSPLEENRIPSRRTSFAAKKLRPKECIDARLDRLNFYKTSQKELSEDKSPKDRPQRLRNRSYLWSRLFRRRKFMRIGLSFQCRRISLENHFERIETSGLGSNASETPVLDVGSHRTLNDGGTLLKRSTPSICISTLQLLADAPFPGIKLATTALISAIEALQVCSI